MGLIVTIIILNDFIILPKHLVVLINFFDKYVYRKCFKIFFKLYRINFFFC